MNEPNFDFGIRPPDTRSITIRVVNSMLLRRIDGEALEHIEAGSVVTITREDLGSLSPGDWQPVEP